MMRAVPLLVGTILGGALVAACYSDTFRDKCKTAISGVGNEIDRQLSGLMQELFTSNKTKKEQGHDGQSGNDNLPAPRC